MPWSDEGHTIINPILQLGKLLVAHNQGKTEREHSQCNTGHRSRGSGAAPAPAAAEPCDEEVKSLVNLTQGLPSQSGWEGCLSFLVNSKTELWGCRSPPQVHSKPLRVNTEAYTPYV